MREEIYCFHGGGHLLRTSRWAYLEYDRGGRELYDMQTDPRQFTNLAERVDHAPVLADMQRRLQTRLATIR